MKMSRRIDEVVPGHFRIRLIRKGPWVAARIEIGDYGYRAYINGQSQGFPSQDPLMADAVMRIHLWGTPIEKAEYDRLLGGKPSSPELPVRLSTLPSIF